MMRRIKFQLSEADDYGEQGRWHSVFCSSKIIPNFLCCPPNPSLFIPVDSESVPAVPEESDEGRRRVEGRKKVESISEIIIMFPSRSFVVIAVQKSRGVRERKEWG